MIWATGETANAAVHLPWFSALDPTGFVREYRALVAAPVMLTMFFLLARRQKRMSEERSELQAEMRSAQEMQQLLMPAALDLQPWIQVEVAYLPAKDVGGDFYFCRRAGSRQLVVIGDVSGKGLRAAMLASNVIGALRNEDAGDPGLVLSRLNEVVLQAHSGGFVTCLCALFEAGGRLRVANAGHLAPYVDGVELAVENCLPLGIVSDASYVESSFLLEGKTITLLSDGVLEAKDAKGELLGFECMAALTTRPAAQVAAAAQKWGQEDDITVLTISS
jgi:serine phosphatase RsbU (regulator of sigma subunit)